VDTNQTATTLDVSDRSGGFLTAKSLDGCHVA
jgi:hypothetical protein